MRSALYLSLLATVLIGAVLCDHHGNNGNGKKDKHHGHGHDHDDHHHHGGKGHDHKHHASENMTCHKIAGGNSDFAFRIFQQAVAAGESHNIFYSPVSISIAFAMLSLGARAETLTQLIDGLGFNRTELSLEDIHEGFHHLIRMLNDPDGELQLSMGNALFIQEDRKLLATFLDDVKNKYESEAFSTNFQNNEEAKKQINDYVEKQTQGKIVDLVSDLDTSSVMYLVNSIFFRGKWEKPFDVESTREDDFHVNENTTVKVPMMYRSGMYNIAFDNELSCTVVQVPYKGGATALFILPRKGAMKQVEDAFSKSIIMKWIRSMRRSSVDLYLPKFNITSVMDLKAPFGKLGITEVFSDQADLSGITGEPNVKVSKAVHKAVLSIDEKGTEAAGTTAIEIMPMSLPPTVKFDCPFIVSIYSKTTRSTLFMGRIVNPNAK